MNNNQDLVDSINQCKTTSYLTLGKPARHEYLKVCRFMIEHRTLKTCDLPVVAAYAQAQIDMREAQKAIDKLGMVITGTDRYDNPKTEVNPAVKIKKDASTLVSNLALMLGFTPLGRKRLKGEEAPQKSASEVWDEQQD